MTRRAKELAELLTSVVHAPTAWVVSIGVFTTEARRHGENLTAWQNLPLLSSSQADDATSQGIGRTADFGGACTDRLGGVYRGFHHGGTEKYECGAVAQFETMHSLSG
jgi:hypothetical protein